MISGRVNTELTLDIKFRFTCGEWNVYQKCVKFQVIICGLCENVSFAAQNSLMFKIVQLSEYNATLAQAL